MPRVTDISLVERPEQPIMSIRFNCELYELQPKFMDAYQRLSTYLKENKIIKTDIPFAAYYNLDIHNLDVEVGIPVLKTLKEKEDIKVSKLEGGIYAICIYQGNFDDFKNIYDEMENWIKENGYERRDITYEFYANGLNYGDDKLITRIMMGVKK